MFTADVITIGNEQDGGFFVGFTPEENRCKVIRLHGEECIPCTEVWCFQSIKRTIEPFVTPETLAQLQALTNEIEFDDSHLSNPQPYYESLGFNGITEELYKSLVSALTEYHKQREGLHPQQRDFLI